MKKTTARFQREGEKESLIANAVNCEGYLCQSVQVGVGPSRQEVSWAGGDADVYEVHDRYEEVIRPMFDARKTPADRAEEAKHCDSLEKALEKGMGPFLIRWGKQDGYTVTDEEENREKARQAAMQQLADGDKPVDLTLGFMGLRIIQRLPTTLWEAVKPFARYEKADEGTMEHLDDCGFYDLNPRDVRGWYYKPEAIDALVAKGAVLRYRGVPITSHTQVDAINARVEQTLALAEARRQAYKQQAAAFSQQLLALMREGEFISPEEADRAARLPKVTLLDWEGPNIYGGGRWLHVDGEDLYLVQNNGMDGDDWSRNNYGTGGAGAMIYKAAGKAGIVTQIREWLKNQQKDL